MSRAAKERQPAARGDATRERLVGAALELFGNKGFGAVGAREISKAAGAPLAAIPYHFGTKEALYRAALERVRKRMAEAIAPAAADAEAAVRGTPQEARDALLAFQGALLTAIAVAPEAKSWAKLLLREHMDPSAAFDLVYEDAARQAIELMARLIARASGRQPEEKVVLIKAFARMGEVLIFRTAQEAVTRRLGWSEFGTAEAEQVCASLATLTPSTS